MDPRKKPTNVKHERESSETKIALNPLYWEGNSTVTYYIYDLRYLENIFNTSTVLNAVFYNS